LVRISAITKCEGTSYAFLGKVFNKFGALVEVFINQGMEFHGEFQKLYESSLINHHITSRDHLEVDRLVEQMVHVT
jgi:hypothetical protein